MRTILQLSYLLLESIDYFLTANTTKFNSFSNKACFVANVDDITRPAVHFEEMSAEPESQMQLSKELHLAIEP